MLPWDDGVVNGPTGHATKRESPVCLLQPTPRINPKFVGCVVCIRFLRSWPKYFTAELSASRPAPISHQKRFLMTARPHPSQPADPPIVGGRYPTHSKWTASDLCASIRALRPPVPPPEFVHSLSSPRGIPQACQYPHRGRSDTALL